MNEKFPSSEKLKSKILIDRLFSEGKSLKNFPLKLIYLPLKNPQDLHFKSGVSVPKRIYKLAVDRNSIKRSMREAFRKNKYLVESNLQGKYALMFIYTSPKKINSVQMAACFVQIMNKLIERESLHENTNT